MLLLLSAVLMRVILLLIISFDFEVTGVVEFEVKRGHLDELVDKVGVVVGVFRQERDNALKGVLSL